MIYLLILTGPRVSMRGGAGSIEDLDSADDSDPGWGCPVTIRGGAGPGVPTLQGLYFGLQGPSPEYKYHRTHLVHDDFLDAAHALIGCPEGSDWPFNIDFYRQTDPHKIDFPLQASVSIDSSADFTEKWPDIEAKIGRVDHDQLRIIIEEERYRGEHAPVFYEDLNRLEKEFLGERDITSYHYIFSYFGRMETSARYLVFKDVVTKLLNIDPKSNWSFLVDVHLDDRILPPIHFTRAQYRNDFLSLRDQYLIGAANNNAKVFVRHVTGYAPSQLNVVEPPKDNMQIIRLLSEDFGAQTYWKVPSDPRKYCINQLQPAFIRAFLAIFGQHRPFFNLRLSTNQQGTDFEKRINFGGMEVTSATWEWVVQRIEQQKQSQNPISCEISIDEPAEDPTIHLMEALTLHLIGDDYTKDTYFKRGDYGQIYNFILERLRKVHRHSRKSKFPDGSFIAMWFSAIEREEDYPPVLMEMNSKDSNDEIEDKLMDAFRGRPQTFNNIWFRPEYQVFTIHDHKEPHRVWQWNTTDEQHNTSLENFRENVRQMYDDWDSVLDSNFVLIQPHADHMFAVDRRTTETYWRRYIFDWFTETDIYVERRGVRPFCKFPNEQNNIVN